MGRIRLNLSSHLSWRAARPSIWIPSRVTVNACGVFRRTSLMNRSLRSSSHCLNSCQNSSTVTESQGRHSLTWSGWLARYTWQGSRLGNHWLACAWLVMMVWIAYSWPHLNWSVRSNRVSSHYSVAWCTSLALSVAIIEEFMKLFGRGCRGSPSRWGSIVPWPGGVWVYYILRIP